MIEFVHDECQIDPLHPGMISPGLYEAVGSAIALKPHFLTDGMDELPGLATLDRYSITVDPCVEKNVMLRLVINTRIGFDVFNESLLDIIIICNRGEFNKHISFDCQ